MLCCSRSGTVQHNSSGTVQQKLVLRNTNSFSAGIFLSWYLYLYLYICLQFHHTEMVFLHKAASLQLTNFRGILESRCCLNTPKFSLTEKIPLNNLGYNNKSWWKWALAIKNSRQPQVQPIRGNAEMLLNPMLPSGVFYHTSSQIFPLQFIKILL